MKNVARLFAVALFAIAGVSVASAPKVTTPTAYVEGGAPVPWCWPDDPDCQDKAEQPKAPTPKRTVDQKVK